jgi:CHAT domain-containing protein
MLTEKDSIIYLLKYKRELDSLYSSDTTNYKHNTEQFLDLYLKIEHFKKHEKQSLDNFLDTDTSFLGYNKIKNKLAENDLILQFIVSPNTNQVFFFCFSDGWSDYGYLTSYESLYSISQKFSQSIRKFELEEVKSNSKLMSDILKEALPPDLNKYNHLIIIPDGFLWHIPFDAISNPYNKSTYLIDRLNISTHLSCNLLLFETNNSNKYTYDFVGFAPFATTSPLDIYESIPSSGNEIIKAAEALEAIKFESICIKDTAANFTNFLEYSQKARILHFATHFDFNPESSTQGLLLNSSTGQLNQRCVGYQDVLYSGSAPELVILSACNSSSEMIQTKGEGPINLNRAFIMNGTKNIIYSINKINDKFSEEFYEIFYQSLVQGLDFGHAFQKAKRQIIKTTNYSHPFFWSSFQMISIL